MLEIDLSRESEKYLKNIPTKHSRQVVEKVFKLAEDPCPPDASQLRGYEAYYRADIGEHRIIYRFSNKVLRITLIGKRNDDDVYRKFERLMK